MLGSALASWLMHSTPDRVIWDWVLAGDIVLCSWARHLTLLVPFSTQVYKWVLVNIMLGITLWWTSIPSRLKKVKSACEPTVTHQARAYPGFYSMKQLGVFLLPLNGMLVHPGLPPSIKFVGTNSYIWEDRGTVRVKCLAQEHNTISLTRAKTWTACSGVEGTNQRPPHLPHPVGGVEILLVASCYWNRDKLRLMSHLAGMQTLPLPYHLTWQVLKYLFSCELATLCQMHPITNLFKKRISHKGYTIFKRCA